MPRDEDVDAWVARLTGLGAGVATARTAAIGPDHLWRLVEDPTADALPRAAAAFALRADVGPEGRARLQSLAARCADPTLADALVRVGGDDAAAAVAALAAMRESTGRAAQATSAEG